MNLAAVKSLFASQAANVDAAGVVGNAVKLVPPLAIGNVPVTMEVKLT